VEKLPLFALSVFSAVITLAAQGGGGAMKAGEQLSLIERFSNAAVAYVFYLEKLILPRDLALFYPHPGHWPLADIVGSLVVLLMITAGSLYWARRYPWLLVGWAIFLGMLVPVIGVIQVGAQAAADRYTYLPSIGLFVMLVFGLREICLHFSVSTKFASIAGATLIGALTMLGVVQTSHWQNSQTIWRHSLIVADAAYLQVIGVDAPTGGESIVGPPRLVGLSKPYLLLARAYDYDGQLALALLHYEQSLLLWPDQTDTYYLLGLVAAKLGQKQKALAAFDQAGARDPDNAGLHRRLQRLRQFLGGTLDSLR
jgi:tetratricopeptide (TPR) repeat protein